MKKSVPEVTYQMRYATVRAPVTSNGYEFYEPTVSSSRANCPEHNIITLYT